MASLEKRGATYTVRYRDASGRQHRESFKRLAPAKARLATVQADLARGEWIDPARAKQTLTQWWATYWASTVDLRASSRARDESYFRNHIAPTFGDTPLAAINHAAITGWVAELVAKGLAPATVLKAKQILSKALAAAVDSEVLKSNPAARVKTPKVERHEMMFLAPEQVTDLAERIDDRFRALVYVGAYCGLRIGELAGLKRTRVDLLHRRIEVAEIAVSVAGRIVVGPPKTAAGRRGVPVPSAIVDVLGDQLGRVDGDLVFPAPGGGYLRPELLRRRYWAPAVAGAGLDGLRLHDLRHTAVALWIAAGASPKAIAAWAGHASVVTVLDRYGHLLPGHEDAVADRLDEMFHAGDEVSRAQIVPKLSDRAARKSGNKAV